MVLRVECVFQGLHLVVDFLHLAVSCSDLLIRFKQLCLQHLGLCDLFLASLSYLIFMLGLHFDAKLALFLEELYFLGQLIYSLVLSL